MAVFLSRTLAGQSGDVFLDADRRDEGEDSPYGQAGSFPLSPISGPCWMHPRSF